MNLVHILVESKICAQNETTKLYQEIVAVNYKSATDATDCKNVKADNKFEKGKGVKAKVCSENYSQIACLSGSLFCYWDTTESNCQDYAYETEINCVSDEIQHQS